MRILDLDIRRFRNIDRLAWSPPPGISLIWGDNGQGKTNLLEAAHFALTGRSFRTRRDDDLIPRDGPRDDDPTLVQATIAARLGERRLRVALGRGCKRLHVDGHLIERLADLWGESAVVTFTPEDAALLKGPPVGRRRFLDAVLAQASRRYLDLLQRYQQALRRLNAVYKRPHASPGVRAEAEAFYPALAEAGAGLMVFRARRLAEAATALGARYNDLGGAGTLEIHYEPDADFATLDEAPLAAAWIASLAERFDESRRFGATPFGVHRDDFSLRLDDQDLRRYGSQGQHRLTALALKLEAAAWLAASTGAPPILLLDDFGSELDPSRRQSVLHGLRGAMQVLVTATDPADFGGAQSFDSAIRIEKGRIGAP